jgi:Skp family chaperone for outer membrane proteins
MRNTWPPRRRNLPPPSAVFVALAVLAGAAAAQQPLDPCMQAYNEEIVAIEREAKAKQSTGSAAAKQRAAGAGQSRLEAAARRAKECQAGAKAEAAASPSKPASADECNARVNARIAELERRSASGALEQNLRRDEELRLRAELNECNRVARPVGK